MACRVFISYQHLDRLKAKGFHLLRWNKNVDIEFVGRHLLDPVNSENRDYIARKVKEQLADTSMTVVLIGKDTSQSEWVANEIRWSLEKGNGILGIQLDTAGDTPKPLLDCGAEVIGWNPHDFKSAIDRALRACGRAGENVALESGSSCAR
jgi:antiphage defense system Thoeris ThsB-like protein